MERRGERRREEKKGRGEETRKMGERRREERGKTIEGRGGERT